jgi:hypothetical protein
VENPATGESAKPPGGFHLQPRSRKSPSARAIPIPNPEVAAVLPPEVRDARAAGPRPYRWADPATLAEFVAGTGLAIAHLDVGELRLGFPSIEGAYDWFLDVSGPFQAIRAAVGDGDRAGADLRAAFVTAWERHATHRDDGGVDLAARYRVAVLTRTP